MNDNETSIKIPDGIEMCEDKCPCGGTLRLHTYTFRPKNGTPTTKHYIDCDRYCGRVVDWHDSVDSAIEAFDKEYNTTNEIVSNPIEL